MRKTEAKFVSFLLKVMQIAASKPMTGGPARQYKGEGSLQLSHAIAYLNSSVSKGTS